MYYCVLDMDDYRTSIDFLVRLRDPFIQALYADLDAVAEPGWRAIEMELNSKEKYSFYELCIQYEADKRIKWENGI